MKQLLQLFLVQRAIREESLELIQRQLTIICRRHTHTHIIVLKIILATRLSSIKELDISFMKKKSISDSIIMVNRCVTVWSCLLLLKGLKHKADGYYCSRAPAPSCDTFHISSSHKWSVVEVEGTKSISSLTSPHFYVQKNHHVYRLLHKGKKNILMFNVCRINNKAQITDNLLWTAVRKL